MILALHQLGYLMLDKPNTKLLEEFVLTEEVENLEVLKRIIKSWGEIHRKGKAELGKKNYVAKEPYT